MLLMGHKGTLIEKWIIISYLIEKKVALKVSQIAGFFFFKAMRYEAKKINHEGNSWGSVTIMVAPKSIIVSSMNNRKALLI